MYSITKCCMNPKWVPTDSRLPLQTPFLSYGVPHFLGWRQHPFKESADPSQDADNQGQRDLAWYPHGTKGLTSKGQETH